MDGTPLLSQPNQTPNSIYLTYLKSFFALNTIEPENLKFWIRKWKNSQIKLLQSRITLPHEKLSISKKKNKKHMVNKNLSSLIKKKKKKRNHHQN